MDQPLPENNLLENDDLLRELVGQIDFDPD